MKNIDVGRKCLITVPFDQTSVEMWDDDTQDDGMMRFELQDECADELLRWLVMNFNRKFGLMIDDGEDERIPLEAAKAAIGSASEMIGGSGASEPLVQALITFKEAAESAVSAGTCLFVSFWFYRR